MTTITLDTMSQSETSFMLRRALGPGRGWQDFLADCIRDKTSHFGLQLLPIAYVKGRCRRPVYSCRDVAAFIAEARLRCPPPPNLGTLQTMAVQINTISLRLPPRSRTATAPGAASC